MTTDEYIQYAKAGTLILAVGVGVIAGAFHGLLVGTGSGFAAFGVLLISLAAVGPDN